MWPQAGNRYLKPGRHNGISPATIDDHFKGGPAYHYDVALDKFMVNFNIKEFLNNHVGINSWDDLDEDGRKA